MDSTRKSIVAVVMLGGLCLWGCALWVFHADAWDLGHRSPVLNFDAAQYALAARVLASTGHFGTTFVLPIELARNPASPWPLAAVQPGLVLAEAALFKFMPKQITIGGRSIAQFARADQIEWLALALPFSAYLLIACVFALAIVKILQHHDSGRPPWHQATVAFVAGLVFLLDPEAQHLATGGFTEMPFTAGLAGAFAMLALGLAGRRPFAFGLVLGITGLFRGSMLWLAPVLVIGAAATAPRERRTRVALLALAGYALPLVPWWLYKWRAFSNPGWDLSALALWDGVQGNTWFSLAHGTEMPAVPSGPEAFRLLAAKFARNAPGLAGSALSGVRAFSLGALAATAFLRDVPRVLRVTALVALAGVLLSGIVAALGVPNLRYLFPTRTIAEAAGVLAAFALLARIPKLVPSRSAQSALAGALIVLFLGWGLWLTSRGLLEASDAARDRGLPSTLSLLQISVMVNREVPHGEPVMSNLGPNLAWYARRDVIHLALTPEDVDACRRLRPFQNVILAFRDPARAWPGWDELMRHPVEATHRPEWNVARVRVYRSPDGFTVVWLEMGPLEPARASASGSRTPLLRPSI